MQKQFWRSKHLRGLESESGRKETARNVRLLACWVCKHFFCGLSDDVTQPRPQGLTRLDRTARRKKKSLTRYKRALDLNEDDYEYKIFPILMHLSMVCPRIGWGGGGEGKLGHHLESNSHPWGELIGTHNSLYYNTERLQRVFFFWWQSNGTQKLCAFPQVWKTYSSWVFSVAGNLTHILYSRIIFDFFHTVFTAMQNVQCQNMTCYHDQEGLCLI